MIFIYLKLGVCCLAFAIEQPLVDQESKCREFIL